MQVETFPAYAVITGPEYPVGTLLILRLVGHDVGRSQLPYQLPRGDIPHSRKEGGDTPPPPLKSCRIPDNGLCVPRTCRQLTASD